MADDGYENDFKEIDTGGGNYIGFGEEPGQKIVMRVLEYSADGGTDFNDNPCPVVEGELLEPASSYDKALNESVYEVGEIVKVNGGVTRLRTGIRRAAPEKGDVLKFVHEGMIDIKNGKSVKDVKVFIARSGGGIKKGVARKNAEPDF